MVSRHQLSSLLLGLASIALGVASEWLVKDPTAAQRTLLASGCILMLLYPFGFRQSFKVRAVAVGLMMPGVLPLLISSTPSLPSLVVACLTFSLVRSEVLCRAAPKVRRLVELGLMVLVGLSLVYFYDGSSMGTAFSLWVFWLVQAVYPLLIVMPEPMLVDQEDRFSRSCVVVEELLARRGSSEPPAEHPTKLGHVPAPGDEQG